MAAWRAGLFTDSEDGGLPTETSEQQAQVEESCQRLFDELAGPDGTFRRELVQLRRSAHLAYLHTGLGSLGEGYASLDASRPWLCYWMVHSLAILSSESLSPSLADGVVGFIGRCNDPVGGGFCGGPYPGQSAHLAPTYAAVNTLVTIGTSDAYAVIDRAQIGSFLLRMKREDGSFTMHDDGEADVRGAYCAMAVAALTGMLDARLARGTADWLLQCQTYEGGIGATPGEEAHGGYTFCGAWRGLAAPAALRASPQPRLVSPPPVTPTLSAAGLRARTRAHPHRLTLPSSHPPPRSLSSGLAALVLLSEAGRLRLPALVAWLCQRQMAHSGGFQGRTNKLVDSCYSFWQGGAFPLVQSVLQDLGHLAPDTDLYHAPGLLDYILVCAQAPHGGLRDKPGKGRDYYHTCYALSGLAVAAAAHQQDGVPKEWVEAVGVVNPVFNVLNTRVEQALRHFAPADVTPR
jgi:protein farnesyltransferase subunit beta